MEEHFAQIALGKAISRFRGDEAALNSTVPHAVIVDAASVILHLDVDMISPVISAQANFADLRLASGDTILAGFDSMCDRVAHQVNQRIGNLLDDAVIQFGFAAA